MWEFLDEKNWKNELVEKVIYELTQCINTIPYYIQNKDLNTIDFINPEIKSEIIKVTALDEKQKKHTNYFLFS